MFNSFISKFSFIISIMTIADFNFSRLISLPQKCYEGLYLGPCETCMMELSQIS